ncbi:MAG: alpha/beta hydrolase [Sphingomonadaceae bacterium]|nr:alpha/beta hydrolase [Sphingomonadaceae bacterium]
MNRRCLLLSGLALALIGAPVAASAAPPFQPSRFSVQVVGRGPDVILIPGLTSGREVWRATVNALPGYRYHLLQVSGFAGEAARGNRAGPVIAPLADEIARYIADRHLRRPAIVGHSMGGTLAMMIAARRPELVGKVMVVDMYPQPAGLFGGTAESMSPLASIIASPGGRRLFANLMGALSPPEVANRSDPDVVGRAVHDLAVTDLTAELPRIRAPLTIVYAAPNPRAGAVVDRSFRRAYAAAPHPRFVRIDGSGHMVMFDQPARLNAAVAEFLRH